MILYVNLQIWINIRIIAPVESKTGDTLLKQNETISSHGDSRAVSPKFRRYNLPPICDTVYHGAKFHRIATSSHKSSRLRKSKVSTPENERNQKKTVLSSSNSEPILTRWLVFCRCQQKQEIYTESIMGVKDMAEKAASDAAYANGGWSGWFKYKAARTYQTVKTCSCCS